MKIQRGSAGDDVARLESRLADLGLYSGPIDGVFGGGVESAVKTFQKTNNLSSDGIAGPLTWERLFPGQAPPRAVPQGNTNDRCLALTGSFEASVGPPECYAALSGDFDGQGISFGALQWNLGQGTLQPLLLQMLQDHPDVMADIFHEHLGDLQQMLALPREAQIQWARAIQDVRRHVLLEPWHGMFKALGRTPECLDCQRRAATTYQEAAKALFKKWQLKTERGRALMFDICVQNGGIGKATEAKIRGEIAALPPIADPLANEENILRIIANRRADAASPAWREDVRRRKLTIANGEGKVHGVSWNLEEQFGIGLRLA